MNNVQTQLEILLAEVEQYNNKPNKALSARIRAKLGQLKKDVTGIRANLVELDKAGY